MNKYRETSHISPSDPKLGRTCTVVQTIDCTRRLTDILRHFLNAYLCGLLTPSHKTITSAHRTYIF